MDLNNNNVAIVLKALILQEGKFNVSVIMEAMDGRFDAAQCACRILERASEFPTSPPWGDDDDMPGSGWINDIRKIAGEQIAPEGQNWIVLESASNVAGTIYACLDYLCSTNAEAIALLCAIADIDEAAQ